MTTRSLPYTMTGEGPPPDLPAPAEVLGRAGRENFRVASRLLPAAARSHLLAFYGFARLTDQIGDAYAGDRLAALDWLEADTRAALDAEPAHPLVAAAARSVLELGIDSQPLFDLIEANRIDQTRRHYARFDDLRRYCELSANPVGRLVLGAFGASDDRTIPLSDAICTGLQLVEHWQDVKEDAQAGRVYVPAEDLERFGVDPATLAGSAPAPQELRALMAFEVARARTWLDRGQPLIPELHGRARWAVAGFVAGGRAALDAIAARDFDVLSPPGRPRPWTAARYALVLTMNRGRGRA